MSGYPEMTQKIYINGYFLIEQRKGGVSRFSLEVLIALGQVIESSVQLSNQVEFILLVPKNNLENIKFKNIQIQELGCLKNKYFWEQVILPLYVGSNFLINLANFAPIFKKNQLCVIHDALIFRYPQAYSKKFQIITSFFHRQLVKRCRFIATVSQFSAREITDIIGKPQNEITVIGNSAEHMKSLVAEEQILERFNLKPQQYILSVFSQKNSRYKNIEWYLRAVAKINYQFVCVGRVNFDGAKIPDNLLQIGYVSDQQLKGLYQNALGLLFPSLYEGFGIPPLEAMTCGCPAIVADISVMHEVCGAAALYCDPYDESSLVPIVAQLLDNNIRQQFINKGYTQIKQFDWLGSAKQLMNTIIANIDGSKA